MPVTQYVDALTIPEGATTADEIAQACVATESNVIALGHDTELRFAVWSVNEINERVADGEDPEFVNLVCFGDKMRKYIIDNVGALTL
ncbi:hypothetical protein [Corynebacterium kalidii]